MRLPTLVEACLQPGANPTARERLRRWRAQAATYLLRPNERTLAAIARRRTAAFAGRSIAPGTISVHVRKGDKWVEAEVRRPPGVASPIRMWLWLNAAATP